MQQLGGGLSLAQRPGLVGKQYSPHPERPRHAAVQMQLHSLEQTFQNGGAQTGPNGQQYYDADYKVVDDDDNNKK